ncbi:MAG: zinc-dependent alcohol dehydrogenase family protein [Eubacteriales bacterium]|nr:zinc-dependent alcohol dehydrogenase family protein [Eubacteriales bacterium]
MSTSKNKKMRAAVFYQPGEIRVEDRDIPQIKEDEVLIQVMAAGVCGTDMHIFDGAKGASECFPPVVLGHEFSGIVTEVGSAVTKVNVGDHVTADPSIMCGKCYACQIGKPHFCTDYSATGVTYDGGFEQYCAVKEKQVFKLKKSVSFEEGAMCEPLGCCLHGIDRANIKTGDTVLVIGGGTIGLIMAQLAKIAGAAIVIVSEPIEEKREKALELGADYAFNPMERSAWDVLKENDIREINVAIECVGRPGTMMDAFKFISPAGHILLFGLTEPDCEIPFKPYEVFKKELTITASYVNPYTHGRAVDLVNSGNLHLAELISDRISVENIHEAFRIRGKNGKMMILPNA